MAGAAHAASASIFIDYFPDGDRSKPPVVYEMPPFTVGDFAMVEQEFMRDRKTPVDVAIPIAKKLTEAGLTAQANYIMMRAYEEMKDWGTANQDKPEMAEVMEFLDKREGMVFTMWIMFKKKHPDITKERVMEIIEQVGEEEIRRHRDVASGLDYLGNSTGVDATTASTPTEAPPPPDASLGAVYTGRLPKPTTGPQPLSIP